MRNLSGLDVVALICALLAACGLAIRVEGGRRSSSKFGVSSSKFGVSSSKLKVPSDSELGTENLELRAGGRVPQAVRVLPDVQGEGQSGARESYERWVSSKECEPPSYGEGSVLGLMAKHDLGKRHWLVSERLRQIEAGPGRGVSDEGVDHAK